MSEPTDAAPAKKKLHNPLHVTLAVAGMAVVCAVLLNQGTETKYVFGLLLAVTLAGQPDPTKRRSRMRTAT